MRVCRKSNVCEKVRVWSLRRCFKLINSVTVKLWLYDAVQNHFHFEGNFTFAVKHILKVINFNISRNWVCLPERLNC